MRKHYFDKLVRNSLFVFSVSMLANVLAYLYQIAMGNLMSTSDYGTINALLSLSLLLSIPSGMITSLAVNMSTRYHTEGQAQKLAAFVRKLAKYSVIFAVAISAIGALLSGVISKVLQIDNYGYIIAAVLIAAVSCVTTVFTGTLQGLQRFGAYSFYSVVSMLLRLILGIVFAVIGWRVVGGLGALLLAAVGSLLYAMFMLRDIWLTPAKEKVALDKAESKRYLFQSFWFQLYLLLMSNGDVLIIKAFAPSAEAVGVYSSGSVIGKIALYISNALVIVLFPLVAEKTSQGKSTIALFKKSVALGGGTALLCSAGILLLGKPMIPLLFGERYREATELLLPIAAYVIPVALLTILINYLMPIGRVKFFAVTMGAAYIGILAATMYWCRDVAQILYVMGGALFLAFVVNCIHLFRYPAEG